jgi:predicted nucleic acid-binding protein
MASKALIIDTSVWISYFDEDDSNHKVARDTLDKESAQVRVPEYILLEVVTVLRLKKLNDVAEKFIRLATNPNVYLPAGTLGLEIAKVYNDKKFTKLSFVDTGLALLSKEYRVITFDKDLKNVLR